MPRQEMYFNVRNALRGLHNGEPVTDVFELKNTVSEDTLFQRHVSRGEEKKLANGLLRAYAGDALHILSRTPLVVPKEKEYSIQQLRLRDAITPWHVEPQLEWFISFTSDEVAKAIDDVLSLDPTKSLIAQSLAHITPHIKPSGSSQHEGILNQCNRRLKEDLKNTESTLTLYYKLLPKIYRDHIGTTTSRPILSPSYPALSDFLRLADNSVSMLLNPAAQSVNYFERWANEILQPVFYDPDNFYLREHRDGFFRAGINQKGEDSIEASSFKARPPAEVTTGCPAIELVPYIVKRCGQNIRGYVRQ